MSPSPVDLLRLPAIPLTEVYNAMFFKELFNLSQCSKKTAKTIKRESYQKNLSLYFGSSNFVYVYGQGNDDGFRFNVKSSEEVRDGRNYDSRCFGFGEKKVTVPVDYENVKMSLYENAIFSYWDHDVFAFKTIVSHLMEVFKVSIKSFYCSHYIPVEDFLSFMGDIMEKQGEIKKLGISVWWTDNDLKWTLDNVNVTEKLEIEVKPSRNFKYNFKMFPKIMSIYHSFWITLENLLCFNSCQVILLKDSKFSNQDMDVFMESWKDGKFPKLEILSVESANLNVQEPVAGIFVDRDSPNGDKYKKIGYEELTISAGWDIQRNDGIMGTIKVENSIHLKMIVRL